MSVKLLDNSAFYGFRVRRTVQGKVYQEYFSLKDAGRRVNEAAKQVVYEQALARDAELKTIQKETKLSMRGIKAFKADGSIKGISCLDKQEKSGNTTPIFQLGISSDINQKIVCTSVSINAYGEDEAWRRVVNLYCMHKQIDMHGEVYEKLLAAKEATLIKKSMPQGRAATKLAGFSGLVQKNVSVSARPWL